MVAGRRELSEEEPLIKASDLCAAALQPGNRARLPLKKKKKKKKKKLHRERGKARKN